MSTDNSEALRARELAAKLDSAADDVAVKCDNVFGGDLFDLLTEARDFLTRPSTAASEDAVAVCRMIVNLGPEDDDLRAIRIAAERVVSSQPPVSYGGADLREAHFVRLYDTLKRVDAALAKHGRVEVGTDVACRVSEALAALAQSTASSATPTPTGQSTERLPSKGERG